MLRMETDGSRQEQAVSEEVVNGAMELSLKYGQPVKIEGTDLVAVDGKLYSAITLTDNGIGEPLVRQPGKQLPENFLSR